MTGRVTIAIDIDDTIADSTEALRLDVNARSGIDIPREAYQVPGTYWGYYERVWVSQGVAERVRFSDHLTAMAEDQSHVPLLAGASAAITELAKRYHIILITSRDESWERATKRWFVQHFDDLDVKLYFAKNHRDASALNKGQLCRQLGASVLIDDSVEHCNAALSEGVDAVLFGVYGWHHGYETGAVKCANWPAVVEYVYGRH